MKTRALFTNVSIGKFTIFVTIQNQLTIYQLVVGSIPTAGANLLNTNNMLDEIWRHFGVWPKVINSYAHFRMDLALEY